MDNFIPDKTKKPKEAPITLSTYRKATEPRDNVPIAHAMEGLAVRDEVDVVEHAKKDEKKKGSKSKSPVPKKVKDNDKEKANEKAKEEKKKNKEKEEKKKDKEKAEKPKVDTPKSPPKVKDKKAVTTTSPKREKEKNVQDGCAPDILVSQVMELGMKPVFDNYLSHKLVEFKANPKFRRGVQFWNLLGLTNPFGYEYQAKDFDPFTAEDLLQNFLSKKTDAGETFRESLSYDEEWMWDCMVTFDTMKQKDTTFGDFMRLLDENITTLEGTTFEEEHPGNFQALKKLYEKYWDRKNRRPKM